ncbi:MAG: response regulator transcription factor [Treponema sp.]|jgi:DNA-binding response OmpR family regulator|nr:response regulator transcription factor [Treponema sp.]
MPETKPKILIIEDDREIAAIEKDFLEINGFEVVICHDGMEGQKQALAGGFALILLDLMLPGRDGMAICREIRDKIDIPILMVTARMEDNEKIRGLGFGADDYVVKPFSPTELVARVKSHIARYVRLTRNSGQAQKPDEVDFGWLRINNGTHQVFVNEIEVTLTHKEYELLSFLASNPEMVFSKEKIYDKIWGEDMYGDLKTVAVHINRLREKIEKNPSDPVHIQTVWGAGYRFLQ